jgi:hypothetical protein
MIEFEGYPESDGSDAKSEQNIHDDIKKIELLIPVQLKGTIINRKKKKNRNCGYK